MRNKQIKLSVMIPALISKPGAYQWKEVYQINKKGKMEIFLEADKPFEITNV